MRRKIFVDEEEREPERHRQGWLACRHASQVRFIQSGCLMVQDRTHRKTIESLAAGAAIEEQAE